MCEGDTVTRDQSQMAPNENPKTLNPDLCELALSASISPLPPQEEETQYPQRSVILGLRRVAIEEIELQKGQYILTGTDLLNGGRVGWRAD